MKPCILIVDDEALILLSWEKALTSSGYDVKTASSGKKALEIIQEQESDIVFTDLIMPGMNGVELCKKIKKISPDTVVVLVSGHPQEIYNHQRDFIDAGGREAFLRKPLFTNEIIETVETIMKEKA